MGILENLLDYYNHGENEVSHFTLSKLLMNPEQLFRGSIQDVADYCNASTASISRLVQKIGYGSYTDFKYQMREAYRMYPYQNWVLPGEQQLKRENLIAAYTQSMDQMLKQLQTVLNDQLMTELAGCLYQANRVRFYTKVETYSETMLQSALLQTKKSTEVFHRQAQQAANARLLAKGDYCIMTASSLSDILDLNPLLDTIRARSGRSLVLVSSEYQNVCEKTTNYIVFDGGGTNMDIWFYTAFFDILNMYYRALYFGRHANREGEPDGA